jgi:hypothetical protein
VSAGTGHRPHGFPASQNSRQPPGNPNAPQQPTGWNTARREITVAALLVLALTTAAWVLDGTPAAITVLAVCTALALAALRTLIAHHEDPPPPVAYPDGPSQSFRGFWRAQADLSDATRSLQSWDMITRPNLINLFAARLSERHGISLADSPDEARRLLLSRPSRHDLWFWIDPQRPTPADANARPGIPPGALTALIDRLEHL